ncbi:MAG: N-acetylmuramoyl-L-alanine amidase [Verrucomicrobiota bacterium]
MRTVFLLVTFLVCGLFAADSLAFSRVVLDPGHGGHDSGARSGYTFEKHLAFDVARRVDVILREQGIRTTFTRERDNFIPLSSRVRVSNSSRNAIFVSIHFNSAPRSGAKGLETFYYSSNRDSYYLARFVQSAMLYKTRQADRGVKHGTYHVLRHNKRPSILVECGFVSNSTDRRKSLDPDYRQRIAEGIAMGILRFKKGAR